MIGTIIGDIVGSIYTFENQRTKKFEFFDIRAHYTDETILTCAVANIMRKYIDSGKKIDFKAELTEEFLRLGWLYPDVSYSRSFVAWLFADEPEALPSAGLGCAMRVAPAALLATSLAEAEEYAQLQALVTHTHAEGIKGAKAVAAAIYLAKQQKTKEEIKAYIEENYYRLDFTYQDARRGYQFNPTCPGTIPPAFVAFFESTDFEDAIRNAIGMGGNDAMAAITGSIAGAYYGVPEEMKERALLYLDDELRSAII